MKTLSNIEKFNVIRPVLDKHDYDKYCFPIIKRINEDDIDFNSLIPINLNNVSVNKSNTNKLILMFTYDMYLDKLWTDPLKYLSRFKGCALITTPDFSIYDGMNENIIKFNIYRNRWLGCLYQDYGLIVAPTISWGNKDTYDICFSGVEPNGIYVISTLGCKTHKKEFFDGYNEMMKRLKPKLVIVYGDLIEGMYGRILNYKFSDSFNHKGDNIPLYDISKIAEIKEVK